MKIKFKDVFDEKKINKIPRQNVVGIDIGSRQAKAVLLHDENIYTAITTTGYFMDKTADELLSRLQDESGIAREDIDFLVGTGYGRIALNFTDIPNQIVTEISCHALGACYLGNDIHTIVDIGGQDSKAIKIDPETGKVLDFAMNDKCAAGTGRFLEKISNVLGYDVKKIGDVSLQAENPTAISSQCVVFAESEVISGRAKGVPVNDLAAGIHLSVAKRVNGLLNRVGIEPNVMFTGGVSNNVGMRKAFEQILGFPFQTAKIDTVYAGALGAALYAGNYAKEAENKSLQNGEEFKLDMSSLQNTIELARENYLNHRTGHKKNVATLCAYTPLEILAAADVAYYRIMYTGTQDEIIAGETLTQSVFCDCVKSLMGGFLGNNPYFNAIDQLYHFFSCECMTKATEAINVKFIPAKVYNVPRCHEDPDAKSRFIGEIVAFKKHLEQLTGKEITEESIRENIVAYNQAKQKIRQISDYRKCSNPLITSAQFQKITRSYYELPVDVLNKELDKLLAQLSNAKAPEGKKIRLMLSGGVVANGDDKITKIVEEELGACIVIEDNCTGLKPLLYDLNENGENVYEDIAEGYLKQPPCARMKPITGMIEHSVKLAKEYKVDGVIFYFLKFCPCYSIIVKPYIDAFQKENIPVFMLPGDYAAGDEGQIKTRVEAFIEMLS